MLRQPSGRMDSRAMLDVPLFDGATAYADVSSAESISFSVVGSTCDVESSLSARRFGGS